MIRTRAIRIVLAAGLLLAAAAPAGAQDHDGTIGYGGGGIWFGDLDPAGQVVLGAGWLADAHIERWYGRRIGVRLHGAFTQRPLQMPESAPTINTWMADGALLLYLLPSRPGRAVAPFVSAGGGVVAYGLGRGSPLQVGEDLVYRGDEDRQPSALAGFGLDLFPDWNWFDTRVGVRLEAADHVVLRSPFRSAAGETFGPVHNVRVTLSLIGLVDLLP
jgi:hypothetical protein